MSRFVATVSTRKRTPSCVVNTPEVAAGGAVGAPAPGSASLPQPFVLVCAMSSTTSGNAD